MHADIKSRCTRDENAECYDMRRQNIKTCAFPSSSYYGVQRRFHQVEILFIISSKVDSIDNTLAHINVISKTEVLSHFFL